MDNGREGGRTDRILGCVLGTLPLKSETPEFTEVTGVFLRYYVSKFSTLFLGLLLEEAKAGLIGSASSPAFLPLLF